MTTLILTTKENTDNSQSKHQLTHMLSDLELIHHQPH